MLLRSRTSSGVFTELPLSEIVPDPDNERADIEEGLEELVESVRERGVLEPLLVYASKKANWKYMLKSGHRRRVAAERAGLETVPAIIVDEPEGVDQAVDRLVANLQRRDLSAMERARGFRSVLSANPDLTQADLVKKLGISQPVVANAIRLLGLPEEVRGMIEVGKLTAAHGVALLGIKSDSVNWRGETVATAEELVLKKAADAAQYGWSVKALAGDVGSHERMAEQQRQYREESARQEAERRSRMAEGNLNEEDLRAARSEEYRLKSEEEARLKSLRLPIARRVVDEAMAWEEEKGPGLQHIQLAALLLVDTTYGYSDGKPSGLPSKGKMIQEIEKARDHHTLGNILARLAVASVNIDYYGLRVTDWKRGGWADNRWDLSKKIMAALYEADLWPAEEQKKEEGAA